jgi:hypothetical protein
MHISVAGVLTLATDLHSSSDAPLVSVGGSLPIERRTAAGWSPYATIPRRAR